MNITHNDRLPHRSHLLLFILLTTAGLLLAGCGDDAESSYSCPTEQLYEPDVGERVELWPDPLFFEEDGASPTGYRVNLDPDLALWLERSPQIVSGGIQNAGQITGTARSAGAMFRFTAPLAGLPNTAAESLTSDVAAFYDLSTTPPTRIPFEVDRLVGETAIRFEPLVPLAAGADHLVVITDLATDEASGCVSPSPTMAALLDGVAPDSRFDVAAGLYPAALEAVGLEPFEVVAATTFRTHLDQQPVIDAADDVDTKTYSFAAPPSCMMDGSLLRCDTSFESIDYRDTSRAILVGDEVARYDIPVTLWLPTAPGPHPVVVFGHGLGGNRGQGSGVAALLGAQGIATVAIDAVLHGDHPTAVPGNAALPFLGVEGMQFNTLALRGNFNQTYLDRLQLVRLLEDNPDITGDATPELDMTRLAYWGISLGGLLGPGLMALTPEITAGVLTVGGGSLAGFVQASDILGDAGPLLEFVAGGADELSLFLTVAQSLVDDADPATWADAVARRRLRGQAVPDVLLPTAEFDTIVPPVSGRALARGLGAVHIGPVSTVTPPLLEQAAPLTVPMDGSPIIGYFQFDRVTGGGLMIEEAGHGMGGSPEATAQVEAFWTGWLAGAPEIIDPYALLSTPPL